MPKIVVTEFMTVDGVVETPEAWHFAYLSDDVAAFVNADVNNADGFLFGRGTYDIFAPYWSTQMKNEYGIADHLNNAPKYIVSTTLPQVNWNNSTLINTNILDEVRKLRAQSGGYIGVTGSIQLVRSLLKANLIDELRLLIDPVILGHGRRLFVDGVDTTALKLVSTQTFTSGSVLIVYQPAEAS